ncbi:MAG: SEC-C domain-containing protein [Chloroflexaceae bacterium]|nr:SEC-C domain-containing protein [Chloroflexaceae bacterium]
MVNTAPRPKKPGRNDPCWCGSGRKYKDCHLPIEEAQRTEQRELRRTQETLLPRVLETAREMPALFPAAFELFWNGRYTFDQMSDLDALEERGAERFLTWFAFDYSVDENGTLVERLTRDAAAGTFASTPYEQRLLQQWQAIRLRAYVINTIRKGQGLWVVDIASAERFYIEDQAASKRIKVGEVLVGHLLWIGTAADDTALYGITGAVAHLTSDTAPKLREFLALHHADLQRTTPAATLTDVVQQRSHVLNHFVIALPTSPDPGALDAIIDHTRASLHLDAAADT